MSDVATLEDTRSEIGSNDELFKFWIEQGWKFRKGHNLHMNANIKEYKARLKHEVGMIREKGFVEYFLLVSDLVRWAKDNGIAVGPGRGSSAGSLVCYLLRITEIDPMQYPMLFERFLDPTRTDEPDIDVDFEDTRRDEVFAYAAGKYGQEKVANIINFVRYRGRSALDDIARVYHIPEWKVDAIKAKLIERAEGHPRALKTIEDTYNTFDDVRKIIDSTPALKYAMALEGNMRNTNIHAAGMVIGSVPIDEVCATYQREVDGGRTAFGLAYDKRDATYLGLLKVDVLSLQTMGMIAEVCRWTHRVYDKGITLDELYRLELNDPEVISAFSKGDVLGVFQFEGITTRRICKKVRPSTFQHLADINALARPGADDKQYILNKDSGEQPNYAHPIIAQHLSWTYGVVVYEEQILMILRDLGGFEPAELNKMRKIIHDKLGSTVFNEYYERFIKGAAAHGLSETAAESVWNGLVSASGYAFNIAHSVSYSTIAYWSQYLKIHYPAAFYAGQLLKCSDEVRRGKLILEADRHGIEVTTPDPVLSLSNWNVSRNPEGRHILTAGLMSIPGIGPKTAHAMIVWRNRRRDIKPDDPNIVDVEVVSNGYVDYDCDADWDDNLPVAQRISEQEYQDFEFIDEDMLGVQWKDFMEVKGIGKKTIEKIEAFCNDPDPFKAYETKRVLDSIRVEFSRGGLPGVPEPTHISLDVPPENTFVTYMGIVRKRKYYDAVEQLQKRTSGDLSYEDALEQIDDPHLLKYAALYVEDDYGETIRVAISRRKYPDFAGEIDNIALNRDVVVVQGFSSDFAGISIQTKSLVVLDPYG